MKYFIACLILPIIPILLMAFFGLGALYFGVADQLERMMQLMREHSADCDWHEADV
jgi:hypothetical protein